MVIVARYAMIQNKVRDKYISYSLVGYRMDEAKLPANLTASPKLYVVSIVL